MPENQTAWNSDNQGIKGTIDQTNQTGKTGGWREPEARQQTVWVGLAKWETDSELTADYGWGVATVGESPNRPQKFIEKCARDKQATCIVPSLTPP